MAVDNDIEFKFARVSSVEAHDQDQTWDHYQHPISPHIILCYSCWLREQTIYSKNIPKAIWAFHWDQQEINCVVVVDIWKFQLSSLVQSDPDGRAKLWIPRSSKNYVLLTLFMWWLSFLCHLGLSMNYLQQLFCHRDVVFTLAEWRHSKANHLLSVNANTDLKQVNMVVHLSAF